MSQDQRERTPLLLHICTYSRQPETLIIVNCFLPAHDRDIPPGGGQVAVVGVVVRNERCQAIRGPLASRLVAQGAQSLLVKESLDVAPAERTEPVSQRTRKRESGTYSSSLARSKRTAQVSSAHHACNGSVHLNNF